MVAEKESPLLSKALVLDASSHVSKLLEENLPPHYHFHDLKHIERVHQATVQLAEAAALPKKDGIALQLAALFHSTGLTQSIDDFWLKSQSIAEEYLVGKGVDKAIIEEVKRLIGAIAPGHAPADDLEKLMVDAHSSYLGQKKYKKNKQLLKMEKEALEDKAIDNQAWENEQVAFMASHVFFTKEAEELFGEQKKKNLKKEKKGLKNLLKEQEAAIKATSISANSGARTLFKVALRNHIDLTNIADQKANIMLSINALIITIGLPAFATFLTGTSYLIVPATIFLFTSVATMIIATISTRPIKMDGITDMDKLISGKTNLFFFGNFYRIPQREYHEAIKKVVAERDFLDSSFVNDLYFLGVALGDKFRYLRLCYNVFVIGIIISVIAFVIAFLRASMLQ